MTQFIHPNLLIQSLHLAACISEELHTKIISFSQDNTDSLAYLLLKNGINEDTLFLHAKNVFNLPNIDLSTYKIEQFDSLISVDEMKKHIVFPISKQNSIIKLAIADPSNIKIQEYLRFKTRCTIEPILANARHIYQQIKRVDQSIKSQPDIFLEKNIAFNTLLNDKINDDDDAKENKKDNKKNKNAKINTALDTKLDTAVNTVGNTEINIDTTYDLNKNLSDSKIVNFINKLLAQAISHNASDLHFEPYEDSYRVRFRIDGVLTEAHHPPNHFKDQISARLKIMASLDITERRIPQDGRIKIKSDDHFINLRVSTLPTLWGEKIVLRILDSAKTKLDLDILGLEPLQKRQILSAIHQPQGMIIVTGPTGSGKTVTLYSCIEKLNSPEINISTAEDPIEINLAGINQVAVNNKIGLNFSRILRAFLRQDPDIIMVGEIRDFETADTAIKAAQTGHLVLSTLHTNSAPETLTRLMNMNIERFDLASSLQLIIAQRLVRCLCTHCKIESQIQTDTDPMYLKAIGFTDDQIYGAKIYTSVGCNACNQGYKGRIGIYEVMPITTAISGLILENKSAQEIAQYASLQYIDTLRKSGIKKVLQGITSISELIRVTEK